MIPEFLYHEIICYKISVDTKRHVILGLLGPMLDNGKGPQRWERWRPSVALCQHEDLLVSRFALLYEPKFEALYEQIWRGGECAGCKLRAECPGPLDQQQ